jgi:transposase
MPEVLPPLRQQLSPKLLRDLVKQHPSATLTELCQAIQQRDGIVLSTTSMSRMLRNQGLTCRVRRHLLM